MAKQKVATAVLEITTDVSQVPKGFGEVEKQAQKTGSTLKKFGLDMSKSIFDVGGVAKSAGTAIAGMFAVGAVVAAGKSVIDYAGHVADLAAKLQVSTDAVQHWEQVLGPAGVEIETVAKASAKLTENLASGDKGTIAALKQLGVNVDELKKKKPEEQFNIAADAVGKLTDQGERILAAKTLFGPGGIDMLAALDGNLQKNIASLDAMGMTLSEDTIKAADDFGDALGVMGKQLMAVVATLIGPLLPAVTTFGNALMWVGRNVIGPVLNVAIKGAMSVLAMFWDVIASVFSKIFSLGAKIPGVGQYFKAASDFLAESAKSTEAYMTGLWKSTDEAGDSAQAAAPKLVGLGKVLGEGGKTAEKAAEALKKVKAEIIGIERQPFTNVGKLQEHLTDIGTVDQQGLVMLQALAERIKQIGEFERQAYGSTTAFMEGLENLGQKAQAITDDELKAFQDRIEFVGPLLDDAAIKAMSAGSRIKDAFASTLGDLNAVFQSAFEGGGGIAGAIQSLATRLSQSILSIIPVVGPVLSQFAGAIVGGIKRLFGGDPVWEQVNDTRDAYIKAAGGLAQLNQKAFEATGSLALVHRLLDARTPEDYAAAVEELNEALEKRKRIVESASSRFGPSRSELRELATEAKEIYDYMVESGEFTAEQIEAAFIAMQEALAKAGDQAAKNWVEARQQGEAEFARVEGELNDLLAKRNEMAKGLAAEAPEAVKGVIETQMEGEIKALDEQIAAKAAEYERLATVTGKAMADEIVKALREMRIDPVRVPVVVDGAGATGFTAPPVTPMARGGMGYAAGPALFSTKGDEYFAFSGEGKGFGAMLGGADGRPYVINIDGLQVARGVMPFLREAAREARVIA